jgi:UDP-N-acetylmuramyl pentapeptide phosphotransferase/UDP-N-acetylglucosamine-1-phosphate transferase
LLPRNQRSLMTAAALLGLINGRPTAAAMMTAAFGASLLTSAGLWRWLGARMSRDRWIRPNYRGQPIIAVSGLIVLIASSVAVAATAAVIVSLPAPEVHWGAEVPGRSVLLARSPDSAVVAGGIAALVLLGGFGWLGYRDDTRGTPSDHHAASGFAGHLRQSLRQRAFTTGLQKALGGLVVATAGVQIALWGDPGEARDDAGAGSGDWFRASLHVLGLDSDPDAMWGLMVLMRGVLIVALSANLLNLLDRAPGRAAKTALAWWLVALAPAALVATGSAGRLDLGFEVTEWAVWAGVAVGASAGLLRGELAEQHMLGDTGVNPLGAILGMATVAAYSATVEWVMLGLLAALNLASERWSFSRIIDGVPPLRWLDRLGSPYRD